jgi:hypothetical protein
MSAETDSRFELRSVCDLWSPNRERAADDAHRLRDPDGYSVTISALSAPQRRRPATRWPNKRKRLQLTKVRLNQARVASDVSFSRLKRSQAASATV